MHPINVQPYQIFNMKKKEYTSPWSKERLIRLQFNAMSPATVDTITDDGLPQLDSDDTTLGWIEG